MVDVLKASAKGEKWRRGKLEGFRMRDKEADRQYLQPNKCLKNESQVVGVWRKIPLGGAD